MRTPALLALLLTACAHNAPYRPPFSPPPTAASREDLLRAIPADLFRGDILGTSREGDVTEYLTFVFLRNEPEDQVPMRVALYERKQGEALSLVFVAPTPFSKGDCRRGECRARIAEMPSGFQLSRESFGADHLRADYRFTRQGRDLELTGKGFQTKNEQGETCSVFFDYEKRRILQRQGKKTRMEKMPEGPPPHLVADHLSFETTVPVMACSFPAATP